LKEAVDGVASVERKMDFNVQGSDLELIAK